MEASTTINTDMCEFLHSLRGVAEVSVLTYDAVPLDMQFPPI